MLEYIRESKEIIRAKRLLTDKELEDLIKLEDSKKQQKYLEKIKEELWYKQILQKKI